MIRMACILYCLSVTVSLAQTNIIFEDNFEDGDLVDWTEGTSGHWVNSTTTPISGSRSLKHNLSGISGSSTIFTQPLYDLTGMRTTWRFNLKNGTWDPSSDNRFHVYLMANETNLTGTTVDGYSVGVQFPSSGTPDPVRLSRVLNGTATAIITSATDWASSQAMGIEVSRTEAGIWQLRVDGNGGFDNLVLAGSATDNTHTNTAAFGAVFHYTSTRAGLFWCDDISITQTSATNTPPVITLPGPQSVRVLSNLLFSVTANEADGDFITMTASNLPSGALFWPTNGNGLAKGTISFTPDLSQGGQVFTADFYAADKDGTESASLNITVLPPIKEATNPPVIWINEFNYDPPGTDAGEFIEIAGPAGHDLVDYSLVLYNGANNSTYETIPLSGTLDDEGCGFGALAFSASGIQNGPDAIALIQGGTGVVQFISYEGTVTAVNGPSFDYQSMDIGVEQDNSSHTVQLQGEGNNYSNFTWSLDVKSEGHFGIFQSFPPCTNELAVPTTRYVSLTGGHIFPYTNWAMAATNFESALDISAPGSIVLVSNGTFNYGGQLTGSLTNRILISRAITVKSANGPHVTIIEGRGPIGAQAVRCAFVSKGVLDGFTLMNGHTMDGTSPDNGDYGGGAFAENGGKLMNCIIKNNTANDHGGGVYGGFVENCIITGNRSIRSTGGGLYGSEARNCLIQANQSGTGGGGIRLGRIINCTVIGNVSSATAGGAYDTEIYNSIVYYNRGIGGFDNVRSPNGVSHSCILPLQPGEGNISSSPGLLNLTSYWLTASSPCVNAGDNVNASGFDLDYETRINEGVVDIGADEFSSSSATGNILVAIQIDTPIALAGNEFTVTAEIQGRVLDFSWAWGDGTTNGSDTVASHVFSTPGTYPITLTAWNQDHVVSTSIMISVVHGFTNHVDFNGTHIWPFTSWANAATNIQDAINAAPDKGTVLVAPGLYDQGQTNRYGFIARVALYKPVIVKAFDPDPANTIIAGTGPNDSNAVRGVYAGTHSTIEGFTITNGHTDVEPSGSLVLSGGGLFCESNAVISRCIIVGNSATRSGGGVYRGNLFNCIVAHNSAQLGAGLYESTAHHSMISSNHAFSEGGGSQRATLYDCILSSNVAEIEGGGDKDGILTRCVLIGNQSGDGGGTRSSTILNCILTGNIASNLGGAAHATSVENCVIVNNTALYGGGTARGWIINSIVISNTTSTGISNNYAGGIYSYSCTFPLPPGSNNITSDPVFEDFAAGNYRVDPSSPCIDAGINQAWMNEASDYAGNSRIINGNVDIGVYELVFEASLKAYLQGPFDTNTHSMRTPEHLPTNAPYAADSRNISFTPTNAVDWINVELLSNTNSAPEYSSSAWLRDDGVIVSDNGMPPAVLEAGTGTYYIVLRHRNHLATMSATPIPFTNRLISYDFTTSAEQNYGGSSAVVEVESNIWALIAGDADGDGEVLPADEMILQTQGQ